MARNQKDFTYDDALEMKDAGLVAASVAAQVGGSAAVIDLGDNRVDARVIVDVTAIEVASGDEKYEVELQVSDSASFASGIFNAGTLKFGDSTVNGESADTAVPRRQELQFTNEINGITYRYARLFTRVAGTVATGINYKAFMVQKV